MKNMDIVDNLSTLFVDGLVIFSIYVDIVEKLSPLFVENPDLILFKCILWKSYPHFLWKTYEANSQECKQWKSYPQRLWISP